MGGNRALRWEGVVKEGRERAVDKGFSIESINYPSFEWKWHSTVLNSSWAQPGQWEASSRRGRIDAEGPDWLPNADGHFHYGTVHLLFWYDDPATSKGTCHQDSSAVVVVVVMAVVQELSMPEVSEVRVSSCSFK